MFLIIVKQIIKMLLLLLLGMYCYRKDLISQEGSKVLANILLMVINPMVAITALQIDYTPHLAQGLLLAYLLAFLTHLGAALLSSISLKGASPDQIGIERFSMIYSNCGFIGIPLVQSVLGDEGVLYLTAYMTVFNFFTWTHGVAIITGKTSLKDLKEGLMTPMIYACVVGLVLFFARIHLPEVVNDSMSYVASMNTPVAMMIAGVSVAQTDLRKMVKNIRIYFVSFGKLIVMPALVLVFLCFIHVDFTVACTILIAASCPAAASANAFALRFNKDYRYASEIYAFTTLASLFTVPIFVYLAEHLLR